MPVRWNGSLEWRDASHGADTLATEVLRMRERGTEMHLLDAAGAVAIQPGLQLPANMELAWAANDGALEAPAATRLLLERAQSLGAKVRFPVRVKALERFFMWMSSGSVGSRRGPPGPGARSPENNPGSGSGR